MKRVVSWLLTCVLLLTLLPAGAWAAEPVVAEPVVAAGWEFCAALDEHGTVWTWGKNDSGQLGDGTTTDRGYAAPVPGLTDVVKIYVGRSSMMALKADGTLWAWGENNAGELGLGYHSFPPNTGVSTPQQVPLPNQSGVVDVAFSNQASVIVMGDGSVYGWGILARRYQDATFDNSEIYHVYELDDCHVTAVKGQSINGNGFIFLCGSGTPEDPSRLYGWGAGPYYNWQLTDEKYDDRIPREIVFPGSDRIVSLEVSEKNVFAVSGGQDPGIYIWGDNRYGQTGEGTTSEGPLSAPYKKAGYHTSPPVQVSAVSGSTVALHEDGTLWLWGQDSLLQPPGTSSDEALTPTQLPIDHVISLAQRGVTTIALRQDGVVYSRGRNFYGQMGRPELEEGEFDLERPVLREDGTPLSLYTPSGQDYFLTRQVDTSQGGIQGTPSGGYAPGSRITLTAQPWEGYLFTGWEADGVVLADPGSPVVTFDMPAEDVTITALFEKDWPGMGSNGAFQGEIGVADENAIPISTAAQLVAIGVDPSYPLDGSYVLTADLDLSGYENWTPIGGESPFSGIFDGQGHVISHLTYRGENTRVGLFGWINERGQVKNLGLEQVSISVTGGYDDYYVGGIVGQFENTYTTSCRAELCNCYVTGEITADLDYGSNLWLGGLAGELAADASDCFNLAAVSGTIGSTSKKTMSMGGIAGKIPQSAASNDYVVERCFNSGELLASCFPSELYVGGIVGHLNVNVTLRQCYNTADIWLEPWSYCGRSAYLGGIAGVSYSPVSECYNLGDVGSGQSDSGPYYEMVCGGIVGQFAMVDSSAYTLSIEDCYSAGTVVARAYGTDYAGGIVGKVEQNGRYLYVERCVVLSLEVSAYMDSTPGGMGSSGPFKASVLGTDVSASSGTNYYQNTIVTRGEGMLSKKGASDVSQTKLHTGGWYQDTTKWDFEQCWAWDKAENGGLPYFQWKTGTCLLLSYDGKQVRLYCGSNTPAAALRVAAYDGEGRLLCVSTAMPELSAGVNTVPLTLEQEGAVTKVFLWRATNNRPLARSLTL